VGRVSWLGGGKEGGDGLVCWTLRWSGFSRCGEFVRVAGREGVRDVFEGGR
jgi:hypothetical protein